MLINTNEKSEKIRSEKVKQIRWAHIVLCFIGLLVARIDVFDGFYTIGTCYIGALFFDKELRKWGTLFGILGLVSVAFMSINCMKYLLIIFLIISFRAYLSWNSRAYSMKNQILITGCAFFIINLLMAFSNGFKGWEVLLGLLEMGVAMALVGVLCYGTEVIYKKRDIPLTSKQLMSMTFLIACALGGMIDFYIQVPVFESIYFRDVMIFVILIIVTYLGGANMGVSMSLIISTILVIIGYMPAHFVAIYTLAALFGSVFSVLDRIGVVFATGVGLLVGFALFNERVVDMPILGAYLVGALVSMSLPKSYFGMVHWFGFLEEEEDERHLLRVQNIITEKLNHFSKAFYNLSSTFEKISDKKVDLDEKDINYIIEDTGEIMCKNCSMNTFCWEDYLGRTYQCAYKMVDIIEQKGKIKGGDIPEAFQKGCINAESFACTLGFKLDLFKQNLMWKNRAVESRKLVGHQFRAVAESIGNLCKDIEKEFYFNKEDEAIIKEALHAKGIRTKDIMVLESNGRKENIHIYIPYHKTNISIEERVTKIVSEALELKIELEKCEHSEEKKYTYFKYKVSKVYKILAGAAFQAKGDVSGDVYSFMETNEGQYLLALADGMGSGKLAMEESTATIELLENFMDSGFKNDLAVRMINSVLVLKSDVENFSTMDITLIDEYTGIAEFLKMGAAMSFILRDNEVTTIESNTLPVGILNQIDMEIYKKQLRDGDVIVMVTDGLLQGERDPLGKEDTFKHFILEANSHNPSYMAEYLMQKSRDLLGNANKDDMTIIVARVWKKHS